MAFKLVQKPTFTRNVEFHIPVDGGFDRNTAKATFRLLTVDERAKYDLTTEAGTLDFLHAALIELEVEGGDKQLLPWNDALRDQVLAFPYTRRPIGRAYLDAVDGERTGN